MGASTAGRAIICRITPKPSFVKTRQQSASETGFQFRLEQIDETSGGGFDDFAGWSLEAGMYGAETSPCNVEEYLANLQAGDGYYLDPGVNGGWCKTIPAANVEAVREDVGTGDWQTHHTGVTYLPHSAATELRWKVRKTPSWPRNWANFSLL